MNTHKAIKTARHSHDTKAVNAAKWAAKREDKNKRMNKSS